MSFPGRDHKAVLRLTGVGVRYEAVRFTGERRGVRSLLGLGRRFFSVLDDVFFEMELPLPGCALVGPNGCGKTTLLRAIAGVVPATGSITWQGNELVGLDIRARGERGVIFIPFERSVFPSLSVVEHLALMCPDRVERETRLASFLQRSAAQDRRSSDSLSFLRSTEKAGNLSGGQRRLLGLMRLLYAPCSLALLDEAFSGLSPAWTAVVDALLAELAPAHLLVAEQAGRASFLTARGFRVFELRESRVQPWQDQP